jgi:hypothetical protein
MSPSGLESVTLFTKQLLSNDTVFAHTHARRVVGLQIVSFVAVGLGVSRKRGFVRERVQL